MEYFRKVAIAISIVLLVGSVASVMVFADTAHMQQSTWKTIGKTGASSRTAPQYTTRILSGKSQMQYVMVEFVNRGYIPLELANDGKYNDGISAGDGNCTVDWAEGVDDVETQHIVIQPGQKKHIIYKLEEDRPFSEDGFIAAYLSAKENWYMIKIGERPMGEEYLMNRCF